MWPIRYLRSSSTFTVRNIFARYCTIPGTSVCFLVLVVCSFAAYFPRSRQYMNRVSFRLLIYSLISQYALNYLFQYCHESRDFKRPLWNSIFGRACFTWRTLCSRGFFYQCVFIKYLQSLCRSNQVSYSFSCASQLFLLPALLSICSKPVYFIFLKSQASCTGVYQDSSSFII